MVVYHIPKESENFSWNVNRKTYLVSPLGNFRRKRNFLKCSSKFPNGKCVSHLLLLLVPGLSPCTRRPCGNVRGNGTRTPHGNSHSGFHVSHLLQLSTNWFFRFNGKQPMSPSWGAISLIRTGENGL